MAPNQPILVIAGPTATGKSEIGVRVAERLGGEILSADSMQVYRGMDIGTAKPGAALRARVPHHLIDVADPTEDFDVARYRQLGEPVLQRLLQEGRTPVIVGGTGFYIRGLLDGIFEGPKVPKKIRARLEQEAEKEGREALHARLAEVDPEAAARLHPNDIRRVVRALEVYEATGRPLSDWHRQHEKAPWGERACYICLQPDLATLDGNIRQRAEQMFEAGLADECRRLVEQGCTRDHTSMQALGYKEVLDYLEGQCTAEEAREKVIHETRKFARRQLTWFRGDQRYRRLPVEDGDVAAEIVALFR